MGLGVTAFTAFVWVNVLLVLAVFAYEVYVFATEYRSATH
jgi:hypothetical protein